jgi:hypothetical protein
LIAAIKLDNNIAMTAIKNRSNLYFNSLLCTAQARCKHVVYLNLQIFYQLVSFLTPGIIYRCDLTKEDFQPLVR